MPTAPRIIVAAFMLALWLPLLAVLASPRFPQFARTVGATPDRLDAEREALRRATPLWDAAVAGYNRVLYALGTTSDRTIAVAGRDGWLFLGDRFQSNLSQAIGRVSADDAQIGRWAESVRSQEAWLAARGIGFAFVVSPAKWSVHPEKLPAWAPLANVHPLDRLLATRASLQLPDLRAALRVASRSTPTFSPFNSHWTNYGAWVAWRELVVDLGKAHIDWGPLPVPSPRAIPIVAGYNEYAGMLSLKLDNPWTGFEPDPPFPGYAIENADGTLTEVPGSTQTNLFDLPRSTRNQHAPNPRTILLLRDSTADSMSLFFQATFARTIQVDHALSGPGERPDLPGLIDEHHPDLVVWFVAERYLASPPPAIMPGGESGTSVAASPTIAGTDTR